MGLNQENVFMLTLAMVAVFISIALLVIGFSPVAVEKRPSLNFISLGGGTAEIPRKAVKKKSNFFSVLNIPALILKPFVAGDLRKRLLLDFGIAGIDMQPEVFMLLKVIILVVLFVVLSKVLPADISFLAVLISIAGAYFIPELILRNKIGKIKGEIVRYLPDTVDLLGLCVNAGLDFMMALKWVVEKSSSTVVTVEMNNILQEISVGKPRRDALRDMAKKYSLQDLSTFARTLIQADKMGTSVSEALNILSEDMRLARFRRGEAIALKAPLKMLVPLLFCIFPVVFILVGAPIFLDFIMNNPIKSMGPH